MEERDAVQFAVAWAETVTHGHSFAALLGPGIDPAPFDERAAALRARLGALTVSVDEVVVQGDRIAWRWTVRAGSTTVSGVNFQRLEKGRLAEHWTLVGQARCVIEMTCRVIVLGAAPTGRAR
jgi:hypothetical protein